MHYIDAMVAAVPTSAREQYLKHVQESSAIFRDLGALSVVEAWGDEVPEGKQTDFPRAVQAQADETVVISWIIWPDKATRDAAWKRCMEEPLLSEEMPFDGRRMIHAGFTPLLGV